MGVRRLLEFTVSIPLSDGAENSDVIPLSERMLVMDVSSRTPDGMPNRCPVCGSDFALSPSTASFDAPCPNCGSLVWFSQHSEQPVVVIDLLTLNKISEDWCTDEIAVCIVDCSNVRRTASVLLGKLITFDRRVKGSGKAMKVKLIGLQPDPKQLLSITELDKMFAIYDTVDDAIASM